MRQLVDVWTVSLDAPRALLLSPEEQARAARFRFERDRIHWSNARSALRATLANYVDRRPEALEFTYGPNEKPAVAGVEFNISHSAGWAMIAVAELTPVGIDLEAIRHNVEIGKVLRRIGETDLPECTAAMFQRWTRREAMTKALGGQLMDIPTADLRVADLDAPPGFAAALALLGKEPVIRYRGSSAGL